MTTITNAEYAALKAKAYAFDILTEIHEETAKNYAILIKKEQEISERNIKLLINHVKLLADYDELGKAFTDLCEEAEHDKKTESTKKIKCAPDVVKISYMGKDYLKDNKGNIYDNKSHKQIGKWNNYILLNSEPSRNLHPAPKPVPVAKPVPAPKPVPVAKPIEDDELSEDEEDDATVVIKFTFAGKDYLKDVEGNIYDVHTETEVGTWDGAKIVFL